MTTYGTYTAMTGALALMMTTGAAMADVTPAEVWSDWQEYMGSFGFAVTADEAQSVDGLTLTNIVLTQTLPDDAGTTTGTVPQITIIDNDDGTVAIVYPSEMPITMTGTGEASFEMGMLLRTTDLKITASGAPSQITYAYSAAGIGMTMGKLSSDGEAIEIGSAVFDMADVQGSSVMTMDGGRTAEQKASTGAATYELAFTDPEDGASSMTWAGRIDGINMTGDMKLPAAADMNDMSAALDAGFAIDAAYVFGAGRSVFTFTDEGATTNGTSTSAGGKLSIKMDEGGLGYGGQSDDVRVEVTMPPLPFPLAMGMKQTSFDLAMPLTKSGAPQDFGLALKLGGFTLSDAIWALFDPTAKLPRDPATIALDLSGKATILADIMDPAAMEQVEDGASAPAELNALTLNSLLVSVAGAELTGRGAVTLDNDDMTTYAGNPKPVGDVALRLTGANGLMDTLVAMGLIGQDQTMMARMGLGMLAVPGEGDDVLVSDIEFTEGGGIIANGQRLK